MRLLLPALLLLLSTLPSAATAAAIRLAGAPPAYRLEALALAQVAALDLTLSYDAAALVVEGFDNGPFIQGAMVAANLGLSGTVRLGVITTAALNGSGLIGTLRVRPLTATLPRLALQVLLRDADGKLLPVTTELPYATAPAAPLPGSATAPAAAPGTSASSGVTTIVLPRATGALALPAAAPLAPSAAPPGAAAAHPPLGAGNGSRPPPTAKSEPQAHQPAKETVATGAPRERFAQALSKAQTLADLARSLALPAGVRQTPFPALSDGTTPVTVTLSNTRADKPAIAAQNARLLWSGSNGAQLEIDLLPQRHCSSVNLVVVDQKQREIELVIAAPLELDPQRSTADYLSAWQDLDGDGQITLDEAYRLAVNLIVRRPPSAPQPLPPVAAPATDEQRPVNGEKGL